MKQNEKQMIICVLPAALLAILLVITLSSYVSIDDVAKTLKVPNGQSAAVPLKSLTQTETNPNDCLYSGCGNFY